jgi:hypothetical protein
VTYTHNVFLSYRRCNFWPQFVEDLFLPIFEHWLASTLGDETAKIYCAENDIETGESWPYHIADGLAHSRVMVCLLTKQYWSSEWCKLELSQMLARRKAVTRTSGPPPLIMAVLLHDSERLDPSLADIQRFSLQKLANPWMVAKSPSMELLSDKIRNLAEDVRKALDKAPDFDPGWPELEHREFWRLFEHRNRQDDLPGLG